MPGKYSTDGDDKKPAYDLRQIYAEKLLGDTLQKIKNARETRNFSIWFNLLRIDLMADVNQKFDKDERLAIREKLIEVSKIISENPYTYLGKDVDPIKNEKVLQAIFSLELLIKQFMEDNKIYGGVEEDLGL